MAADERRQRIRNQVILLFLVAAGFYGGFILLGVLRS